MQMFSAQRRQPLQLDNGIRPVCRRHADAAQLFLLQCALHERRVARLPPPSKPPVDSQLAVVLSIAPTHFELFLTLQPLISRLSMPNRA